MLRKQQGQFTFHRKRKTPSVDCAPVSRLTKPACDLAYLRRLLL